MAEHVLRAETAAITAGVLLTTLRAGLVAEALSGARRHRP